MKLIQRIKRSTLLVEDVELWILQQLGRVTEVMLLHDGDRVQGREGRLPLRHEEVRAPAVVDVVAHAGDDHHEYVQLCELVVEAF
jgi:hypothetical protein